MEPNKLIKLLRELKRDDVMVVLTDEAIDSLIDIVEKYQKIQEVMDSRPDDDAKSNSKALGEIELIMYGNDEKNVNNWNKIDLRILEQKKKKIVSTKDTLKDIISYPMAERSVEDGNERTM